MAYPKTSVGNTVRSVNFCYINKYHRKNLVKPVVITKKVGTHASIHLLKKLNTY